MAQTYIGAAIRRKEDRRFLTGTGQFVDDVTLPHCTRPWCAARTPMPAS